MKWSRPLPWILAVFSLWWGGCLGDVPRDNPLDPLSERYDASGGFSALVTRYYPPFQGLDGAELSLRQMQGSSPGQTIVVQTDPAGRVTLRDLMPGQYLLRATKDGYAVALDTVEVAVGQMTSTEVRLGGLPVIIDRQITTTHVSRWWPVNDLYQLEVIVRVSDSDGDIDVERVWLEVPSLAFADTLAEFRGFYLANVPAAQLELASLQQLLGRSIVIKARDRAGFESAAEPVQLVRVIEEIPVALSPQGSAVEEDRTPVLRWQPRPLPFDFTYRVDIVRVETNIQPTIQTVRSLPPTQDSLAIQTPLAPGTYFWTLSVVDEFGNRSRSKEAGFLIE